MSKTAREGVLRLGALLEEYGTYEMNGVAFSDVDEILVAGDRRRPPLDRQARA